MTTTTVDPVQQVCDAIAREVCQSIDNAHRGMTRNKAELLDAIRRFDELGLAREVGNRTTAGWLTRRYGMASSTAHEYVSVAHKIHRFPYLEQHFQEGIISYSVVRLLLKYLTEDNERELVDLALELGYNELEIALTAHGETGGEDAEKQPEYYLRLHPNKHGLRLHGMLNPGDAAALLAALKIGEIAYNGVDELLGGADPADDEAVDRAGEAAQAIEPALTPRQTASGYGLPIGRKLVQALMGIVHIARTAPKTTLTTPAAHVNIVATTDGRAYMPNNIGVPSAAVANVIANAAVRFNTVDETGLIINSSRSRRLASNAQINALMVMWGGQCAAPGCTHTRFIEIHHIQEWENGGHTDLENLLPLCSACHSLVTDGYLRIVREASHLHFIYGDGSRYVSENHSLPRRCDSALTAEEYAALMDEEEGGEESAGPSCK